MTWPLQKLVRLFKRRLPTADELLAMTDIDRRKVFQAATEDEERARAIAQAMFEALTARTQA